MKRIKALWVILLIVISEFCIAATPTITNVKAQYLHPWGKVAISYEVKGDVDASARSGILPSLWVSAKDVASSKEYCADSSNLSGDTDTKDGLHMIVWDMEKQGVSINSENVVFSVSYVVLEYLVIDLSAGKDAESYPVSYLHSEPTGGWTDEYKTTKLVLRRIEPGSFKMSGSYNVMLTKPYYIGVFEVTQKQFELVVGYNNSHFSGATLPVEKVSWLDIRSWGWAKNWPTDRTVDSNSFVGKLRIKTGLTFDLPTEAQWEYACRAGTTTTYYWGNSRNADYAWYQGNSASKTHSVGTKKANAWGLYDMSGNVWELCLDWYGGLSSGTNPEGPSSGSERVLRGGSWNCSSDSCTSSYRTTASALGYLSYTYDYNGFRLACSAE